MMVHLELIFGQFGQLQVLVQNFLIDTRVVEHM